MLRLLNLKEYNPTVEQAIALIQIEIEGCKKSDVSAIKVLHGYGSHGVGGAIFLELKRLLPSWKKQKYICDYIYGSQWNMFNEATVNLLNKDKSIIDEEINHSNPGITIIVLK